MEWPRGRNAAGYGQLQTWDKSLEYLVHRQAYRLAYGFLPKAEGVLHRCDNPPCFRPDHLFLGGQDVNMQDCKDKGRVGYALPERPHNAKFSDDEIRDIRKAFENGTTQTEISILSGVRQTTISRIVLRQSYKHVV